MAAGSPHDSAPVPWPQAPGPARKLDEPFRFTGAFPATACSALRTCSSIPAQRPPGPVGLVLLIDDLVASAAAAPGGPPLGEHLPVRDGMAGVLAPPLGDRMWHVRDRHPEDERQARGLDRFLVRLRHHPLAAAPCVDRWPVLGRHERAAEWLQIWTDLGRAPRTMDAYRLNSSQPDRDGAVRDMPYDEVTRHGNPSRSMLRDAGWPIRNAYLAYRNIACR